MLTCDYCQFNNPPNHKFCQRCGKPLVSSAADNQIDKQADKHSKTLPSSDSLQVRLMPPDKLELSPAKYLSQPFNSDQSNSDQSDFEQSEPKQPESKQRYQVVTVLSQGRAQVTDQTPEARSPLQLQLPALRAQTFEQIKQVTELPVAAYPYLLLSEAAPPLYDAWQQGETALLIVPEHPVKLSLIKAFSTAIDPLQHVYWMYQLVELWTSLAPIPQWRSSLLQADNVGIDEEQSLRIIRFIPPSIHPPQLPALKAFLQSLLAQPHRGEVATLRQLRRLILAVTSANTLTQLSDELAAIGEGLLSTPAAITPSAIALENTPENTPENIPAEPKASAMTISEDPWDSELEESLPDLPEATPTADETETLQKNQEDSDMSAETDERLLEKTLLLGDDNLADTIDSGDSTMVLPMKLVSLDEAGQTNVGRQRDHNEDCFLILSSLKKHSNNKGQKTQAHCLYVLCDGMGGHDGGEVASQLAAQTLSDYFEEKWPHPLPGEDPKPLPTEEIVVTAVKLANQAIFEVNEQENRAGHERMGTTLVMVLLQGTSAVVAHVGDSRLYKHTRRLGLTQATVDHEVGQREIQRGVDPETAYARPDAYQLTQALGPRSSDELAPSVSYLNFSEDTLLLLCSDGLSDNDLVEDYLETHIDPLLRGRKEIVA